MRVIAASDQPNLCRHKARSCAIVDIMTWPGICRSLIAPPLQYPRGNDSVQEDERADWTARIAERKIAEALEQGAFDNLPGRGQPISIDDDAYTPPHMRAANRILRNARASFPTGSPSSRRSNRRARTAERFFAIWRDAGPKASTAERRRARRACKYERLRCDDVNDLIPSSTTSRSRSCTARPFPCGSSQLRLAEWDEAMGVLMHLNFNTQALISVSGGGLAACYFIARVWAKI